MNLRTSALTAALTLLLLGCGGGSDPDEPVPVTSGNLEGYWAAVEEDAVTLAPLFLHFGGHLTELPGEARVHESLGFALGAGRGRYELDGDTLRLMTPIGGADEAYFTGRITRLSASEMTVESGFGTSTFRRMEGCAAPGLWWPVTSRIEDAAFGPDGALHVLAYFEGEIQGTYAYIAPGRCTVDVPPLAPSGDGLHVASDGTVVIADVRWTGSPATSGVFLTTIPPEPWTRESLDETRERLGEDSTTASRAAAAAHRTADGATLVVWANGGTFHTWSRTSDAAAWTYEAVDSRHNSSLSPQYVETFEDPDGGVVVRGGADGQRFDPATGSWSPWDAPEHPELGRARAVAYGPGGQLHAAFAGRSSLGELGTVVVGRLADDGTWETVEAAVGSATGLFVRDDGSVDLAGHFAAKRVPMWWAHVGADFAPLSFRQAYTLGDFQQSWYSQRYSATENVYPLAAFGPGGDVFVGTEAGFVRRPRLEGAERHTFTHLDIVLEAEAPTTVTLPTLGITCTETCTHLVPPREVFPLRIDVADGTSGLGNPFTHVAASAVPLEGGFGLLAQHSILTDDPSWRHTEIIVRSTLRRMVALAPLGPEDAQSSPFGLDVAADGTVWAVAGSPGGGTALLTRAGAGLEAPQTVPLEGLTVPQLGQSGPGGALRARPGGGVVLEAMVPSEGPASHLVFLDEALAIEKVVSMAPEGNRQLKQVAVTPTGGLALYLGWLDADSWYEVVPVTVDGPGAAVKTPLPPGLMSVTFDALGSGLVAAFHLQSPTPYAGRELQGDRTYLTALAPSGQARWVHLLPQNAVWRAEGDAVLVFATFDQGPLELAGQTFTAIEGGPTDVIVKLDGQSGAVTNARTGRLQILGAVTALATGADGFATLESFTTMPARLGYIPFDDSAPVHFSHYYGNYAVAAPCLVPGAHCGGVGGLLVRAADGFTAAVRQGISTTYDGTTIPSSMNRAVLGLWRP